MVELGLKSADGVGVNEFGQVLTEFVLRGVMRLVAILVSSELGVMMDYPCKARSCSWEGVHACVEADTSLAAGTWWKAPTLNYDGCSPNCWFIIIPVEN